MSLLGLPPLARPLKTNTPRLIRVNYAALNVEEFGSVYEGLLEYQPAVDRPALASFRLQKGDERVAATGSHYTPDELVHPLDQALAGLPDRRRLKQDPYGRKPARP
jgi:hypothetical protein